MWIMRDMRNIRFTVFHSREWLRFIVAWLKLKINWEYRAFSARYITDTACRRCTTRIPFPFSVFLPDGRAFVRAKGNVRERQWGLGYNAWQIDCLNRIGFNELHRRASKGQKGTTNGKTGHRVRNNENTKTDRAHRGKNILAALSLGLEYINFAMSRIFCIHRMCTLCALWKYRRWTTRRGLFGYRAV